MLAIGGENVEKNSAVIDKTKFSENSGINARFAIGEIMENMPK